MGWSDELAAAAPSAPTSWADELAASKPVPAKAAPSFMDQLGYTASAFGHHLIAPLHGAAQFVENGIAAGASKLPDNPVSRYIVKTAKADNQAVSDWEHQYQAAVPDGWGADVGAVSGAVAPFVLGAVPNALKAVGEGVATRLFPTAAGAAPSLVARATSGAVQGAAVGAAQPVVAPQTTLSDLVTGNTQAAPSYWDQKGGDILSGAAWGGALPAIAGGINGAWQAGKGAVQNSPLLNPAGYAARNLANQLGGAAPGVAADLSNAPTYVQGSVPTSAQAAGNPRLVMMEKALANANPEFRAKLAELENANNGARLRAVGEVAQTPQALQDAIAARKAVTDPMRQFTVDNGNPVPVGGINSAVSSVANGPLGVRPTIGSAANAMRSEVQGMTNVMPPNTLTNTPGSATASPAMLDALRQNSNDYLSKFAPNGYVGTQEQAAIAPIKSAIISAINDANPGHKLSQGGWGQGFAQAGPEAPSYRDYLETFAKKSVPINTMQVGQELQQTLQNKALNSAGDPTATLTNYRSALAKALNGSDYAIDPQAQKALEAVQADLQRSTISNSIRAPGSDTAYNAGAGKSFLKAMGADTGTNIGPIAAGVATTALTGSPGAGFAAGVGVKKAGGFVANRVSDQLSELMLDPQKLAAALQFAGKPQSTAVPALLSGFNGRLTPAMAAAIALELQKQNAPGVVRNAQERAYQQ
jgi:hypothetical protein